MKIAKTRAVTWDVNQGANHHFAWSGNARVFIQGNKVSGAGAACETPLPGWGGCSCVGRAGDQNLAGRSLSVWHNHLDMHWPKEMASDNDLREERSAQCDPQQWVAAHGDLLYRFALVRTGDAPAAEELVQETFLAALAGLDGFQGHSSERTWLIGILKHKIVDHLRQTYREVTVEEIDAEVDAYFDSQGSWALPPSKLKNPETSAEQEELRARLAKCLQHLPERLMRAFLLTQIDGLAASETCKVLGVTATNLWVMLHRARLRLRHCLEQSGFGQQG